MAKVKATTSQDRVLHLLRQARLDAGLTQAELAIRLGQPQSFVSKYESGERRLDILELRHICKITGTKLEKLAHQLETILDEA